MRQGAPIKLLAALALWAVAIALVACGSSSSSSSSSGPDPATLVPANAPLYMDVVIKPEGDQKDAVDSFLEKLTGRSDVGSLIVQKLDAGLASDHITYEDDVEPWLSSDAGFFLTSFGTNPDGAAIVPTSDQDAAMAAVEKAVAGQGNVHLSDATYKGVSYRTETGGDNPGSFGIVDDFLVVGTPDAFKAVVDTSQGAASLATSESYKSALAGAPDSPLFTTFLEPKAILQAALAGSQTTPGGAAVLRQFEGMAQGPVAGWLDATSTSAALTFSAATPDNGSGGSESLITSVPDDAWLAFGASNFGRQLGQVFSQAFERGLARGFASSGFSGVTPGAALRRLGALTGIDFGNLGKWLTSISGYVSGTSVFSLGGALVLGTSDEKASAQSLSELQRLLQKDPNVTVSPLGGGETGFKIVPNGTPVEIDVEQADGKVVVGLGQGSVERVLSPTSTLGNADAFKAATGALGDGIAPSFYLDFQPIANLASLAQSSSPDPQLQQALPYLDRLDYLVAGAGVSGDRTESRLVLGVHDAGDSGNGVSATIEP